MMQRVVLIYLLFFSFLRTEAQPAEKPATIYFIRTTGAAIIGHTRAFIDDSLICYLSNNRYFAHEVSPGMHTFCAGLTDRAPKAKVPRVQINLEPGGTYYLVTDVVAHAYSADLVLIEVTKNTANILLPAMKEDEDCKSTSAHIDSRADNNRLVTTPTVDHTATHDSTAPANVYLIRQSGAMEKWMNLRVYVNDSVICKLSNLHYSQHQFPAGNYKFNVSSWDTPQKEKYALDMQLEAGKTYYIRLAATNGFWSTLFYCQEITSNSAMPLLAKFEPDENCKR